MVWLFMMLNDAFKDQNSPLHREKEHYMSVPSVVLIPNCDDAPPKCHANCGHSYINMKTLTDENNESERSSISKSQQILVEYENTGGGGGAIARSSSSLYAG
jgi:hypothetical protein